MRLLEREHELDVLHDGLRQVQGGQGVGFALAGDPGTGKSSTILAALRDAEGLRVLRGQCDPLGTPRPLGPFRELGLTGFDDAVAAGESNLSEAAETALRELGAEPTVLVVEDLHWADAASADVLRYLVRRVETVPLAILVSYRDAEIGPRHPARQLLGDFATLDGVRTLALRPLSVEAVGDAVEGTGLDAGRVHALTGGNPFYVSQVALEPNRPLPASVRDTVLARTAEVENDDLEILQLISCSPDGLDDRLLPAVGVDMEALRRLGATTLLVRTDEGIAFRHELARQAVETTIPPGGSPRLHQRLLDSLEQLDISDTAMLTHHAIAARDAARTLTYATAAAEEALAAASHLEAAAFLEVALEHLPQSAPPEQRAELLMALAVELYLNARLPDAISTTRATIPLWERAGRQDGVAQAQGFLVALEYQSGRRDRARRHSTEARANALASGVPATIALVHRDAGQVAVIGSEHELARECAAIMVTAGQEAGLDEFVVGGRMLAESVTAFCGDAEALRAVADLTETAKERGWDELAWRGYVCLMVCHMEQGRYAAAGRVAEETIAHTTARALSTQRLWHLGLRATVHAYVGRWSAALEDADSVIASGALTGSQWPHLARALVGMRRGDEECRDDLDRGWPTTQGVNEPMRYLPMLSAVAERMWLTGEPDPRITEFAASKLPAWRELPDTPWGIGSLVVWLRRAGVDVDVPGDLPEPHRSHLAGRHAEAAAWWRAAGAPFNEAMALADSPDPDDRVQAVNLLDRLGATATADRVRRDLRASGVASVPKRANDSSRANPGGLTNRQLEVARLLARGYTNIEIAAEAFISPKTAEHHVSAVLAKLALPNRRAVQLQAAELGLD